MISVAIPAWNAAATIGETLASLAVQTRQADEIIVADDGSTDATAAIARAAGARVVMQPHRGHAATKNAAVAAATGDLLAFLDADDLWTPEKLTLQADALANDPGLDGIFGHVEEFICPSVPAALATRYAISPEPRPGILAGTLLIRRAAFDRVGFFAPAMAAGSFIDWCDRARIAGLRLAMRPEILLRRRIHPGSLSHRSAARDAGYVLVAREAIRRRRERPGTT